jgi:hypothetical protein
VPLVPRARPHHRPDGFNNLHVDNHRADAPGCWRWQWELPRARARHGVPDEAFVLFRSGRGRVLEAAVP